MECFSTIDLRAVETKGKDCSPAKFGARFIYDGAYPNDVISKSIIEENFRTELL